VCHKKFPFDQFLQLLRLKAVKPPGKFPATKNCRAPLQISDRPGII